MAGCHLDRVHAWGLTPGGGSGCARAQKMDPQMRKLLEVTHEAFVDSGMDYKALRGSPRVGVYLGCCGSEVRLLRTLRAAAPSPA